MSDRVRIYDALALRSVKIGEPMPAMRGHIICRAYKRGRYLWTRETDNLVVSAHGVPTAKLLAGVVTNQSITVAGFGTNTTAVTIGDTALSNPAYYNAIASHSFPTSGQVQCIFGLTGGTDTGADGLNLQEIALFCNTGAISLPFEGAPPSVTMFAHALLGLGSYGSSLTYSLSWIITT